MRLLITAVPEAGHIVPLLGVAAAARDAGHEVVVATHAARHPLLNEAGIDAMPAGLSGEEVNAERLRRWPETRAAPATVWGVRMWAQIAAPAMARDLSVLVDEWRPDLVVHEEGEYGGPVAAAAVGLAWVTHGWGAPLRPIEDLNALEADVRAVGLWETKGLTTPRFGGLYAHALIDPCPALLDPDRSPVGPTWPVRPSMLGTTAPPHPPTHAPRRCYIGFGTVPAFANAVDDITAAVRAARSAGLVVTVTVSDGRLAESLTHLGADVRPFVSLPDLLPDCAVVATHGGAGTTLAALSHGVPVIVVPQGAPSQERMAAAVERAKVGRCVRAPSEMGSAFADALGAELRDRAGAAAIAIRALPQAESVLPLLESVGKPTR